METHARPTPGGQRVPPREDPPGQGRAARRRLRTRLYTFPERLDNHEIVRTHVSRAMSKINVRSRAQLVIFAYETGLVRAGWSESGFERS